MRASRRHRNAGNGTEATLERARERLEETISELAKIGVEATGEVGDSDPVVAMSDEVQKFRPERIIVLSGSKDEPSYAEQDLIERAERDLDQPVTEIALEGDDQTQHPGIEQTTRTEAVAGRGKGRRPSGKLPQLTHRDAFGLVVAGVGTIVAVILAAATAAKDNSAFLEAGNLDGLAPFSLEIVPLSMQSRSDE